MAWPIQRSNSSTGSGNLGRDGWETSRRASELTSTEARRPSTGSSRSTKGNISVSRKNLEADAALHTDKEIFDRLARGEASPLASMLRGLVQAEGDAELIVLFQGLFPAPRNPLSRQASADTERQPA
jgi:hypothetical protein